MVLPAALGALFAAALLLAGTIMARAADPITIGFGMALTGRAGAQRQSGAVRRMQLWEKDVNAKGGLLRAAGEAGLLR